MFETASLSYGPPTKRVWATAMGFTGQAMLIACALLAPLISPQTDRKSTRLNSSHANISYAVFCLKKKLARTHAPGRAHAQSCCRSAPAVALAPGCSRSRVLSFFFFKQRAPPDIPPFPLPPPLND